MTTVDKSSFTVPAIGPQAQSARVSAPSIGISTVSRTQRECEFISKAHQRTTALCRAGPGPIYDLKDEIGMNCPKITFSRDVQRKLLDRKVDDETSNDALYIQPDSQSFKYSRDATLLFGTEPRGELKSAELLETHSAAFFGRGSPGPCSYGQNGGPKMDITRPAMAKARPFGIKTKAVGLVTTSTPMDVGPGLYPDTDRALGKQTQSRRKNAITLTWGRAQRFAKDASIRNEPISELVAARSSLGNQVMGRNRSEPSIGFGTGTRDARSKAARCMTSLDEGPKSHMMKVQIGQPKLPRESDVMAGGRYTPGQG